MRNASNTRFVCNFIPFSLTGWLVVEVRSDAYCRKDVAQAGMYKKMQIVGYTISMNWSILEQLRLWPLMTFYFFILGRFTHSNMEPFSWFTPKNPPNFHLQKKKRFSSNQPISNKLQKSEPRSSKTTTSWWLNQPIWKILGRGENKKYLKPPPRPVWDVNDVFSVNWHG